MITRKSAAANQAKSISHIRKSARIISRVEAAPSIQDSEHTPPEKLVAQLRKKEVSRSAGKNETVQDQTNYKRVKGKRGHLKMMTEMPVDILLEIFCRLEPIDLLHLSRASKSLHSLLLATNIVYIWKMVTWFLLSKSSDLGTSSCFRLTITCLLPRVHRCARMESTLFTTQTSSTDVIVR